VDKTRSKECSHARKFESSARMTQTQVVLTNNIAKPNFSADQQHFRRVQSQRGPARHND